MRPGFDDFVTARGGVLWRTAWLLTGDADRAEQLLVTALARVWSGGKRDGPPPGGLEDEALAELVRAYLPRREADDRSAGPADWSVAAAPAWTADDEPTIQERTVLLAALDRLTRRQRAVMVLFHGERRTRPEVATITGSRAEAVEAALDSGWAVLRATDLLASPSADRAEQQADRLRARLASGPPAPPYAPTRTADAASRGRRGRRRRSLLAAGSGLIALLALVTPAVVAGMGADDPSAGAVARRCADVPGLPAPDQLVVDQASITWMRFCGDGFAPSTAVVGGLDAMVASWVRRPGGVPCPQLRPVDDGPTRLQLGTRDGQTHVVDLVIGECASVRVDGEPMAIAGRTVFADAVGALGRQLLEGTSGGFRSPGVPHCPLDPMNPRTTGRLTTADYPSTTGLVMPLPAVSGLVCRYRSTPGDAPPPLVESFPVTGHDAEQIRAAYLASGRPVRQCVDDPDGALFAAVLVDATGSWRSFGFDTGDCDALVGPDLDRGSAGYWLVERVRYAVPAHLAQPAAPELEAAE